MLLLNKNIFKLLKNYIIEVVTILILIISFPLYSLVNFYQNDDWVYYHNIQNILSGTFELHHVTAPTFLSIGIIASIWSVFFTIKSLPILTLLISVANFYIFGKILELKFSFSKITTILISLILYSNFLHIYSSIGFMTENYLIFFLLLSIYFFEKSEKTGKIKFLHYSNIFSFFSFYVKQSGIIFLTATCIYYLLKKDFARFKIQVWYLFYLVSTYLVFFPKTPEMAKKDFSFNNFVEPNYIYSLIYGILIYLSFFTVPLIISAFNNTFINHIRNLKILIIVGVVFTLSYFLLNRYFKPEFLAWQEFPYFNNVLERTGFFPRNLSGTKYHFRFNFDYWKYSDVISKISISLVVTILAFKIKRQINVYSISIVGFIILMFFAPPFFDRYILYALPLAIIFLSSMLKDTNFNKILISLFVVYQVYFSYVFSMDFILANNYIWSKSTEISKLTSPINIFSSGTWREFYGSNRANPHYIISYDSPEVNPAMNTSFKVIDIYRVDFFGNLFVNPKIYVYERR